MNHRRFDHLRALARQTPSTSAYHAICAAIDDWNLERDLALIDYLGRHLARWPAHIARPVDIDWLRRLSLGERCPIARLGGHLSIVYWDFGESLPGCDTMLGADELEHLVSIDIEGLLLGPSGARALAQAHRPRLEHLRLASTTIQDEGAQALARAPLLRRVHTLRLPRNVLTDSACDALVRSPYLGALQRLDLSSNPLTAASARSLCQASHWGALTSMDVHMTDMGYDGAEILAGSWLRGATRAFWSGYI